MNRQISWRHSLNAKLGTVILLGLVVLITLVAASIYALSASHAGVKRAFLVGRGRTFCSQIKGIVGQATDQGGIVDAAARDELRSAMDAMRDRFASLGQGNVAEGIIPETDFGVHQQHLKNQQTWEQRIEPALDRLVEGQPIMAAERTAVLDALDELIQGIQKRVELEQRVEENRFARTRGWLLALFAMSLALMALAAWSFWNVTRRVRNLATAADRIAGGNLAVSAAIDGQDEVAALGAAFDSMTAHLRGTIAKETDERARTQAIIDSTADGIVTMDEKGTIQSINAAAQRLFGCRAAEAVGRNASVLVPALYQEGHSEYEIRELRSGEVRTLADECVVSGIRHDGSKFPVAMRVTEMSYQGQRLYIATLQDVTERQRAEEERARLFEAIREAVSRLSAASAEILASTTQQATGAQQQAAAVTETVVTVDEVTQTANQAAEHAKGMAEAARRVDEVGRAGRKSVEDTITAMDTLREQVESVAENILELAERAQAIGEIIATVHEIAERTNLLALNAAIEASRAGEHGRGFAVVAGEVKALAEQSKKATGQVRQILGEIQQATNTAVLSTERGTKAVAEAAAVVGRADETIRALADMLAASARAAAQIVASVGQQATGTSQINEAMKSIDLATKQTLASTRQAEQSARDLNALGQSLKALIEGNGDHRAASASQAMKAKR
jgi:PAS domain S-box-containing protein